MLFSCHGIRSLVLLLSATCVISAPLNSEAEEVDIIDLSVLGPTIYGRPSEFAGFQVQRWLQSNGPGNAEEQGTYFEGDILFPNTMLRNGLLAQSKQWEDGVVPVQIDSTFSKEDVNQIKKAMREYHTHTCIKFVERIPSDKDYLFIQNERSGCWSSVGRTGGRQKLNLQSGGCTLKVGTVIHEMMHALGFMHEHTREDRDSYIQVHLDNVQQSSWSDFQKVESGKATTFGVEYDYGSLQHYSPLAFSKNGQKTITGKQPGAEEKMGQREQFSARDLLKINAMYRCGNNAKKDQSLTWLDKLVNLWGVALLD